MKAFTLLFAPLLVLASCKEKAPPVAVQVSEDPRIAPDGTLRQEVKISDLQDPPAAIPVPEEIPPVVDVDEEEPSPRTPGEHLDRAIERTGHGLQVAGEKTEQGVRTAGEKTEEGLRRAADATGRFLQRAGQKIEEKADEKSRPAEGE